MRKIIWVLAFIMFAGIAFGNEFNNNTNYGKEAQMLYGLINATISFEYPFAVHYNTLCAPFCSQDAIDGYFITGKSLNNAQVNSNATVQNANEETAHNIEVAMLLDRASVSWALIAMFFIMLYDVIVMLIFMFTARLVLWILVELIPKAILSIRDSIADGIVRGKK